MPPAKVEVAVEVEVMTPVVREPMVVEEKLASDEEALLAEMALGKTTFDGNESVQVLFVERSWAPALDVIWFAVPATSMVLVVGMRAV
jgi:hypothetical protein